MSLSSSKFYLIRVTKQIEARPIFEGKQQLASGGIAVLGPKMDSSGLWSVTKTNFYHINTGENVVHRKSAQELLCQFVHTIAQHCSMSSMHKQSVSHIYLQTHVIAWHRCHIDHEMRPLPTLVSWMGCSVPK